MCLSRPVSCGAPVGGTATVDLHGLLRGDSSGNRIAFAAFDHASPRTLGSKRGLAAAQDLTCDRLFSYGSLGAIFMTRAILLAAALVAGVLLAASVPMVHSSAQYVLSVIGGVAPPAATANDSSGHGKKDEHGHGGGEAAEGVVKMSATQMAAAKISVQPVTPGSLSRRITAPAIVSADPDRVVRVAAKVSGTVQELRKRLGDKVSKGELIAVLESREVADAKSDFLAAQVTHELQSMLFERERSLYEKMIAPEQQYLRARTGLEESRLKLNLARQKLAALDLSEYEVDLSEDEVARLKSQPLAALRTKDIRAPASGQIVERRVDIGSPVGGEGQEKELYVITDNSRVWMSLSVPVANLPAIKQGQTVLAKAGSSEFRGAIIFTSPALDPETRSAKVIASFPNDNLTLRAGAFLTAQIVLEEVEVDLRIPRAAVQTIKGEPTVFVRTPEGFEKREVVLGDMDEEGVAIVFGLDSGEEIAVSNTFILKADLGKAEAEHSH